VRPLTGVLFPRYCLQGSERNMGEVIRFVPKSRRERSRRIRESREVARNPRSLLQSIGLALFRVLLGNDGARMLFRPQAHDTRPGPNMGGF
jgi:hypothetical protein